MTEIDFGATPKEQLATLMHIVRTLYSDVYGNGQTGLKGKAEAFMSEADGARWEQERQHKQNSTKLNIIMAICAVCGIMLTVMTIFVMLETSKHSSLQPIKLFHSPILPKVYAMTQKHIPVN